MVLSVTTYEGIRVIGYQGYRSMDEISKGLYVKRADVTFRVNEYAEGYTEVALFQNVHLYAGGKRLTIATAE